MITIPFTNLIDPSTKSLKVKKFQQNNFNLFYEIFSINDYLSNTPLIVNNKNDLLLISYNPAKDPTRTFLINPQNTQGLVLSLDQQNYNIMISLQRYHISPTRISQHEINNLLEAHIEESYNE